MIRLGATLNRSKLNDTGFCEKKRPSSKRRFGFPPAPPVLMLLAPRARGSVLELRNKRPRFVAGVAGRADANIEAGGAGVGFFSAAFVPMGVYFAKTGMPGGRIEIVESRTLCQAAGSFNLGRSSAWSATLRPGIRSGDLPACPLSHNISA